VRDTLLAEAIAAYDPKAKKRKGAKTKGASADLQRAAFVEALAEVDLRLNEVDGLDPQALGAFILDATFVVIVQDSDPDDGLALYDRLATRGKRPDDLTLFRSRAADTAAGGFATPSLSRAWQDSTAAIARDTGWDPDVIDRRCLTAWGIAERIDGASDDSIGRRDARELQKDPLHALARKYSASGSPTALGEAVRGSFLKRLEASRPALLAAAKWDSDHAARLAGFRSAEITLSAFCRSLALALAFAVTGKGTRASQAMRLGAVGKFLDVVCIRAALSRGRPFDVESLLYNALRDVSGLDATANDKDVLHALAMQVSTLPPVPDDLSALTYNLSSRPLLSWVLRRISAQADQMVGGKAPHGLYDTQAWQIDHVMPNAYQHVRDQWPSEAAWKARRHEIGALVPLGRAANVSAGIDRTEDKLRHFEASGTLWTQSLAPGAYNEKRGNFRLKRSKKATDPVNALGFRSLNGAMTPQDVDERNRIAAALARLVWMYETG
jgi:hypothetical protein